MSALQEVLSFSDRGEYNEFSAVLEKLCSAGKLEPIDIPELLNTDADSKLPPIKFYKEPKAGTIWVLKLPSDNFNGSFKILPKPPKQKKPPIKFDGLYGVFMSMWKKAVLGSLVIFLSILLYLYLKGRG